MTSNAHRFTIIDDDTTYEINSFSVTAFRDNGKGTLLEATITLKKDDLPSPYDKYSLGLLEGREAVISHPKLVEVCSGRIINAEMKVVEGNVKLTCHNEIVVGQPPFGNTP